jgi:hypothetical protein
VISTAMISTAEISADVISTDISSISYLANKIINIYSGLP